MIKINYIVVAVIAGAGILGAMIASVLPFVHIERNVYDERPVTRQNGSTTQSDTRDRFRWGVTESTLSDGKLEHLVATRQTVSENHTSMQVQHAEVAIDDCGLRAPYPEEKKLELALCLNQRGVAALKAGNFGDAQNALERALQIRKEILGSRHTDVAVSLNNLAELYRIQGRSNDAQPLYEHALAIREETLGSDHPDVAQSLNNLALIYEQQRKYKLAETLYQKARVIVEKRLGHDHPDLAKILNNMAGLYYMQQHYLEAEPLFRRAQAIWEAQQDLPNLAASLNNLAQLYRSTGRYEEAESLCQRGLAIWTRALGPTHPNVATVLETYADLLYEMNRNDEAKRLRTQADSIRNRSQPELNE